MGFLTCLVKNGEIKDLHVATKQFRTTRGERSSQFLKRTARDLF